MSQASYGCSIVCIANSMYRINGIEAPKMLARYCFRWTMTIPRPAQALAAGCKIQKERERKRMKEERRFALLDKHGLIMEQKMMYITKMKRRRCSYPYAD